jgi:hypothetical protein
MRNARTPTWLRDPDAWPEILAAIRAHDWSYAEPIEIVLPSGDEYPIGRVARDLRKHEEDLELELWGALDELGFAWERPTRQLPRVATKRGGDARAELDARMRSGDVTFREVLELHATRTDRGEDVVATWIRIGVHQARAHGLTLVDVLTEPERTLDVDGRAYMIGAWGQELARAERHGYVTGRFGNLSKVAGRYLRTPHRHHLRNVGLVLEYRDRHGDADIRSSHVVQLADGSAYDLGEWIVGVRMAATRGELCSERRALYESLGLRLVHRSAEEKWTLLLEQIDAHQAAHETTHIPARLAVTLPSGERLGVGAQLLELRRQHAAGELPDDQAQALAERGIDLTYVALDQRFDRGLAALDVYLHEHDGASPAVYERVTLGDGSSYAVGGWLDRQRLKQRRGALPHEQQAALEARGIAFAPQADARRYALSVFRQYLAREGHALVPIRHIEIDADGNPFNLGDWVNSQRKFIREGRAAQEWVATLEAEGFVQNTYDVLWAQQLSALAEFVAREGHADVPARHVESLADGTDIKLGNWCSDQRSERGMRRRSTERTAELDALGFVWNPLEYRFARGVAALDQFIAREGHARPTATHVEALDDGTTVKLGTFLLIRKRSAAQGKLDPAHRAVLEARGVALDRGPTGPLER